MNQRKILLSILCLVILAFLFLLGFYKLDDYQRELEEKISSTRKLLKQMEMKQIQDDADEVLRQEVQRLYQSFPVYKELYAFGQEIKENLIQSGLTISRYQQLNQEGISRMEFYAEGSPQMLLQLLENSVGTRFHVLTLDAQILPARISFQVTPLTLPEGISSELLDYLQAQELEYQAELPKRAYSSVKLAMLFPQPPLPLPLSAQFTVREKTLGVDKTSLRFVGKVAKTGLEAKLFFKNLTTGQVISLSPQGTANENGWRLGLNEDSFYRIIHEDTIYEVEK